MPSPKAFAISAIKDDHALNAAEWIVYDALYAYCRGDGPARQAARRLREVTHLFSRSERIKSFAFRRQTWL